MAVTISSFCRLIKTAETAIRSSPPNRHLVSASRCWYRQAELQRRDRAASHALSLLPVRLPSMAFPCFSIHVHRYRRSFSASGASLRDKKRQVLLERRTDENVPGAVVAVLTLNRTEAANAMGSTMLRQLKECLDELEQEEEEDQQKQQQQRSNDEKDSTTARTRCLVLRSASIKVFSAGADLKERTTMTTGEAASFVTDLRNTMDRIANRPYPVIAAVRGVALGGGLELALTADIRFASSRAVLGLPETSLAIVPGAGGTQRLPRLIGTAKAMEMIFAAETWDAETAHRNGLVQHVVYDDDVESSSCFDRAMDLAWRVARNGPVAIRAAKWAVQEGCRATDMTAALEVERQAYERVLPTEDRLEGLAAFKEGRPPEYKGQ